MRPDRDLLDRLRAGDGQAFDELYEQLAPRVFGFLHRLCGRRDLAEDLHQEVWVKVARHARRLADDTNVSAWVFTVARNQFRSHRRWSVLDAERLLRWSFGRSDRGTDPHEDAAAHAAEDELRRGIAALPLAQREALLLVAGEGYEPHEAAAVLSLSPEAVRQRLARARAALAARLARREAGRPAARPTEEEA